MGNKTSQEETLLCVTNTYREGTLLERNACASRENASREQMLLYVKQFSMSNLA